MQIPPPPPEQGAPASTGATPSDPVPAAPMPPPRKKGPWIVRAVLALVALGVAGVLAMQDGDGSESASPRPSVPEPSQPPAPPTDLRPAPASFEIELRWSAGTAPGADPVEFVISRDGKELARVPADRTRYVDTDVLPTRSYDYEVVAVDAAGAESRIGATVAAKAKTAPPISARLSGVFNVTLKETSNFGYADAGDATRTQGWRFIPTCKDGACATKFSVNGFKAYAAKLAKRPGTYEATFQVRGLVTCSGIDTTSNATLVLRATKAGVVNGAWRVTAIAGTVVQRESAQLGCRSSGADFSFSGKLVEQ